MIARAASTLVCIAIALIVTATNAPTASAAQSSADESARRIRHDYLLSCAGCHGFDGSGNGRVPTLHDTARLLARPGGREYLASVPGVAQAPLCDERLAALLNWVLAEFGGADDMRPYAADEIARLRSHPLRAPRAERERITRDATAAVP